MIKLLIDESKTTSDPNMWKNRATNQMHKYEAQLYEYFKRGFSDSEEKVWTFWNAVFYCGTIFTTIGRLSRTVQKSSTFLKIVQI